MCTEAEHHRISASCVCVLTQLKSDLFNLTKDKMEIGKNLISTSSVSACLPV